MSLITMTNKSAMTFISVNKISVCLYTTVLCLLGVQYINSFSPDIDFIDVRVKYFYWQ